MYNLGTLIKKPIEEFNEEIKSIQKTIFTDSIRSNMINNTLKKIGLDSIEISDAIEQYDLSILTEENCKLLLPTMPTVEEIKEIAAYNGDLLKDLNLADQYILIITGIIGLKERIKAILFYYNYKENIQFIFKEMSKYFEIFKILIEDKDFHKFFEIMGSLSDKNKGQNSSKTNLKLFLIKTTKKDSEILSPIDDTVKYIYNELKNPKILISIEKIKIIDELVDYQNLLEKRIFIENGWKDVQTLFEIVKSRKDELLEEDKTEWFLSTFYNDAKENIENIEKQFEKMDKQYVIFLNSLGESIENFSLIQIIEAFKIFKKELFNSIKQYKK